MYPTRSPILGAFKTHYIGVRRLKIAACGVGAIGYGLNEPRHNAT